MIDADQPPPGAPKAAWAAWLADLGRSTGAFKVFPCRPDDGAKDSNGRPQCKQPLAKGWKDAASWDRKTVEAEWLNHPTANIGLAIQPGFVALDADVYKEGNGKLLDAFEADYGILPRTLEFESANGGYHLIYATERVLGNGTGSLPKFGDVRGSGGYLIGPGSTCDGKPYKVCNLAPPTPLPAHVDARLTARRERSADPHKLAPGVLLDDPANVLAYANWCAGIGVKTRSTPNGEIAKPCLEGQEGNNTLAATGAWAHDLGLSPEKALEVALEHHNPRCVPPWEEDDYERHFLSGYRSAKSQFGGRAQLNPKALGFADVSGAAGAVATRGLEDDDGDFTAADFACPAPARQWAIGDDANGWVPLGELTFLYGPGGVGKTALTGQICLAVARGEPLFGLLPVRKMPTLLIACEDGKDELHRRFEAQGVRPEDNLRGVSLVGQDTALHPPFRQSSAEDTWCYRRIDRKLASMPAGPKLLVLDNLAQMYHGDYYNPGEITRFLNLYLRRLARQHEATVIVLAHPSEGQRASGDGGYGGVQWSNGIRSRLYFERHMTKPLKKGDKPQFVGRQRLLSRKKSNYSDDIECGLILDLANWTFTPVEPPTRPAARLGFKPVIDAEAPAPKPAGDAVGDIVLRAVETVLAGTTANFTARRLAADAAHWLGEHGHEGITVDAIRRSHLPKLIAAGHPAYRRVEGKGLWRRVQTAGKEGGMT